MKLPFKLARLVEGDDRWYILFYQTDPNNLHLGRQRFRPTYDLNTIIDIKERRKLALEIVADINLKLKAGWPFDKKKGLTLIGAIEMARKIKIEATKRAKTEEHYDSMSRVFVQYLHEHRLEKAFLEDFHRADAVQFLDRSRVSRKLGNRTLNNYRDNMRALFNELKERELIAVNPFCDIQKRKNHAKQRRAFSDYERSAVAAHIREKDRMLFLGVLLQFHCFIRPVELRRLRFHHIHLDEGLIRIEGDLTKNWQDAIITIPDEIIPFLRNFGLDQYNQGWLVFGENVKPHPFKACGKNTMNRRHNAYLKELQERGVLIRIQGLSFYSWKDTGAIQLFKSKVDMLEIMRQLRHESLNTTQDYCNSLYVVNKEIKALDNNIITKSTIISGAVG